MEPLLRIQNAYNLVFVVPSPEFIHLVRARLDKFISNAKVYYYLGLGRRQDRVSKTLCARYPFRGRVSLPSFP